MGEVLGTYEERAVMRCDIIIPIWNQLEATRECIDSIMRHTDYPYRLILIDNGSDRETEDYLKGLKGTKDARDLLLIRNSENLGFVKAVNQGIKASDAPYLCVMNNDTIATSGWLKEMVAVMEAHPEIGLMNPSSNTSGQFPEGTSVDAYAAGLRKSRGQIQELYTFRGFCMLLKREVVEKLGVLDEVYHFGYFDDTDYCKRAQALGFRTARAKASYVYHRENTSFKEFKDNQELFKKNERVFFGRWGRHVRVGYFLKGLDAPEKVDDIAINVARSGHQIYVFLKKGLDWPVTLDHFDIRRIDLNPFFFAPVALWKILKRKKKKKLEVLLTDDAVFGNMLNATKPLHGSDVMVGPDKKELLELLKKKSRER